MALKHSIISDQIGPRELTVILRELESVIGESVTGDVVEFGCYIGTTTLFLQRMLREQAPKKHLHVYDSFEGLPEKAAQDASVVGEQFQAGKLAATKQQLVTNFKHAGLPLPIIHKGWFNAVQPSDVPDKICFAFLDGDFYDSILDSLQLVWPRLQPGAVVVVDDYQAEALPGVEKAVSEWAHTHQFKLKIEQSLAILTTQ